VATIITTTTTTTTQCTIAWTAASTSTASARGPCCIFVLTYYLAIFCPFVLLLPIHSPHSPHPLLHSNSFSLFSYTSKRHHPCPIIGRVDLDPTAMHMLHVHLISMTMTMYNTILYPCTYVSLHTDYGLPSSVSYSTVPSTSYFCGAPVSRHHNGSYGTKHTSPLGSTGPGPHPRHINLLERWTLSFSHVRPPTKCITPMRPSSFLLFIATPYASYDIRTISVLDDCYTIPT